MRRLIIKLCLILLLSLAITAVIEISHTQNVSAQSINSLNSDINRLRNRVNRLESTVRSLSQSVNRSTNQSTQSTPLRITERPTGIEPSDEMFKRLATLVIEVKQQVQEMDKRLQRIENIVINR